ncbi:MAG TPA: polysaccharide biosynthesis/export family protein [Gemmatimonadaceae bacterium]|nr:polysaccharide biosynthesis/export family protein [Gemmatimonadaceae bacterium]
MVIATLAMGSAAHPAPLGAQQPAQQGDSVSAAVRRAANALVQPGDRVWLHVWREPKLSDTVTVDERGQVLLPKIGVVNASSMSIAAFRDTVRGRFAEFFHDSPIDLIVLRRIAVNGAVNRPNIYFVDVTTTLRDVIARAGGVASDGDENAVTVIRDGKATRVVDWQSDFSTKSDLYSGDQVVVGRKSWIKQNLISVLSLLTVVSSLVIAARR